MDGMNAHILQSRNTSFQFGILCQILFHEPPGLQADLLLLPRPRLPGNDRVNGVGLGKVRVLLSVLADIFSWTLILLRGA
jgi:hypothetical protein